MKILILIVGLMPLLALAIEEPEYEVVDQIGEVEVRSYPELVVARTQVNANLTEAGNQAFRRLGGYIFGANARDQEISMTAPVAQTALGEGQHEVVFYMPSEHSLTELPRPTNDQVEISTQPPRVMAALRYSGSWSEARYQRHEQALLSQLQASDAWRVVGEPVWARFNSPFSLPFMRRNEVQIPVERVTNPPR